MAAVEVAVSLTDHAYERCWGRGVSVSQAKREVREAALAGRMSKRKPRWAWLPDQTRSEGGKAKEGTYRYLWDEQEERAYLCARKPNGWLIVTVLINPEEGQR
jgi:hypothetical protein